MELALGGMKRYEEAPAQYRVAMNLNPDGPAGHYYAGVMLPLLGRHREAPRLDPIHAGARQCKCPALFLPRLPDANRSQTRMRTRFWTQYIIQ